MEKLEQSLEKMIFAARWLLAPLYVGLLLALLPILYRLDRPHWMGHVDYSGLKIKLIGSLVAISVIELLKDFMKEGTFDANREGWRIGIHMTFVISGVLFALMDMMADRHKSQR